MEIYHDVVTDRHFDFVFRTCQREEGNKRKTREKLHNEEVPNVSFPQNIIMIIISARMRWTGHVTRMKEMRLVRVPRGKFSEKM